MICMNGQAVVKVLHLHGELLKVRSTGHPELVYEWKKDLNAEDRCEKGFPLRPHIVWFAKKYTICIVLWKLPNR